MAALGTIRKRGTILVGIIGLGLFAFIAEEAFRSCDTARNEQRQQIGEVLGEKVNAQDFQKIADEYEEATKMMYQTDNLPEQQVVQLRDQAWNEYVSNKIIAAEAKKLGLTVTDEELQNVIKQGTNPVLQRMPVFMNQQTGRFDATQLQQFLAEYNKLKSQSAQAAQQYDRIYNYWNFIEKTLRNTMLAQKYQSLVANSVLSNPIEAQQAFKDENEESNVLLAYIDYKTVNDNDVQVSDAEMKAKYNELKESWRIKNPIESRDIKYVSYQVVASPADRAALQSDFAEYSKQLQEASDPTEVVRKSQSDLQYLGVPVTRKAFPSDIASRLDSISVGTVSSVIENTQDNTLNVFRVLSKTQLPDSIEFRTIAVPQASADSVFNAVKNGGDFAAIAKNYNGQTGEKQWMTSAQYERSQSINSDQREIFNALNTLGAGELKNISMTSGNLILQVTDRKAIVTKYDVAVIKKKINFNKDTYSQAYNKFSQFVSANQTLEDIQKNAAKAGYQIQDQPSLTTSQHYVGDIRSTREALKWVFQAKEGDVSPLYECGNNDNLLVCVLTKINKVGYLDLDNANVKELVKAEVLRDKKAEQIFAKLKGVNSIDAAKQKGCKVDTVKQITFASPAFVPALQAMEPALSGAVAGTAKGKFSVKPVKGQQAVYLFQVNDKKNRDVKFDEKQYVQKAEQQSQQGVFSNIMNELFLKAKVVDNRYLFM